MRKKALFASLATASAARDRRIRRCGGGQSSLADVRNATAKYHDIEVACAPARRGGARAGPAVRRGTCIANLEGPGAMGIHLPLQDRVDGVLVPDEPEALLYEQRGDGSHKLTGVEYVVAGGPQPTLYGETFAATNLARFGNLAATVWTLHAWIWKPNGEGVFKPWNPACARVGGGTGCLIALFAPRAPSGLLETAAEPAHMPSFWSRHLR